MTTNSRGTGEPVTALVSTLRACSYFQWMLRSACFLVDGLSPRVAAPWWICLASVCILLGADQLAGATTEPPDVFSLITNPPPITELTMRYQSGRQKPELLRFRAQDNAFFAQATGTDSFTEELQIKDTQCGFWEDDYWYYQFNPPPAQGAPPRPPVVFRYHYSSTDLSSQAYVRVRDHIGRLRLFTTLGIALGKAMNPISIGPGGEFLYRETGLTVAATFDPPGPLPTRATLSILDPKGKLHLSQATYEYSPSIAGGRIPFRIKHDQGYSIQVLSLSFGELGQRLPQKYFSMSETLANAADLQQMVHTNHGDYMLVGRNDLVDMSPLAAERRLRDGVPLGGRSVNFNSKVRPYVVAAILLLSALVLTLVTRRRSQH